MRRNSRTPRPDRIAISVVSTGARSAERRDLVSTISGLSWRQGLSAWACGPRSRRRKSPHSELADAGRLQRALDDVLHEADEGCIGVGRDAVAPRDAVAATAIDQAEADTDMVQRHFFFRRVAEAGVAFQQRERRH